jgi:hypothetical protein
MNGRTRGGFPPQDPLYQLVMQPCQAMHHLVMDLYYRSCKGSSARRRRKFSS